MNTAIINHIKGQLKVLRDSDSLDYSKGIIDSLLAFIDVSCPKDITLSIAQGNINLIQAINVKKQFEAKGIPIDIKGDGAIGLLFAKD